MGLGISSEISLRVKLEEHQNQATLGFRESLSDAVNEKMKELKEDSSLGFLKGVRLDDVKGNPQVSYLSKEISDGGDEFTAPNYLERNGRLYINNDNRFVEWIKSVESLFWFPLATAVRKIALPIFLGALYPCFEDGKLKDRISREWKSLMPLKAFVGLIVHPIISLLGVILFPAARFFNFINSDVERWVNGHTDEDVTTMTRRERCGQMPYLMACKQPEAMIEGLDTQNGSLDLNQANSMLNVIRRTLAQQVDYYLDDPERDPFSRMNPVVVSRGVRQENFFPQPTILRRIGCGVA